MPGPVVPALSPEPGRPSEERRRQNRMPARTVTPGPRRLTISHGSTFLISAIEGSIPSEYGGVLGLYSDDTRFLSHHELQLNGRPLRNLGASRLTPRHARWLFVAYPIESLAGSVQRTTVTVTLDRLIGSRKLHEDVVLRAFGHDAVSLRLDLLLKADFADIFEVRTERWQRRLDLDTVWRPPDHLETRYTRQDFERRCLLRITSPQHAATYANGELHFAVDLEPGEERKLCLQYDLIVRRRARPSLPTCPLESRVMDRAEQLDRRWQRTVSRVRAADLRLNMAFQQAVDDFGALRLYDHGHSPDVWTPAAGIPWFVAPFGRDSIIASLQAMPVHPMLAIGTLQKLAAWQAKEDDPLRDAEPGKICHEIRVGEWAHFGTVPHHPYYGTADATPLYLLLLGETFRWLGDAEALRTFRKTALACLDWVDRHGDIDGDGLQEYRPRGPQSYRNQCWRDAEDGVLDPHGDNPPPPIGTCEMQAYVYAAKLAVAGLFDAWGDHDLAASLRAEADRLQCLFVEKYWLEEEGTLAFALDGEKRQVRTATSNPGHCLWLGILDRVRGERAADRLMWPDLFSGWGLRTLSSEHPSYDPHSYQRGSVWPHDTMLAAAGLRRLGRFEDSWRLVDGLLGAVAAFEGTQMPELFAGLARRSPDVPFPYERANVPQAWSAGAVFHAVRTLLGLEPDVPNGRLYIDPALPSWCPELELDNLRVGGERVSVRSWRQADGTSEAEVTQTHQALEVVRGPAPWLALPSAV